eukprot:3708478-Prymnesium_polylepis.1
MRREQIPTAVHLPGAPAGRTLSCQPSCLRAAFHSPLHPSHLFVGDVTCAFSPPSLPRAPIVRLTYLVCFPVSCRTPQ